MFLQHFRKRERNPARAFPHLDRMMGAYFHQDYDIFGETIEEVLTEYARTSHAHEIAATVRELDDLLATPTVGLLQRFESSIDRVDFIISEDDEGARTWLGNARNVLAGYIEQPPSAP